MRPAILFLCLLASPSFAADGIGGALDIASDYVFRGISLSNEQPALQGDIHYSAQGFTGGLWASTAQINWWDKRTVEVDAYLGYRWSFSADWASRISAVHYAYPWNSAMVSYDYDEVIGSLAFRDNIFFTAAWTFDTARYAQGASMARHTAALTYEVALAIPLRYALAGNLGVGHYALQEIPGAGYSYWNAGVGYDWRAWHVDLNYIGTTANAKQLFGARGVANNRVVAVLLWRF